MSDESGIEEKKRILFVTNLYPSEKEPNRGVYIQNQAQVLFKKGYEVVVLQMDYRSIRRKRKLGLYWRKQGDIRVCHFAVPISPFVDLQYFWAGYLTNYAIRRIEKEVGKIGLIHGHFLEGAYGLIRTKRTGDVPIVFTEHGSNLLNVQSNSKEEQRMKQLYAAVDEMIVVGQKQYLCARRYDVKSLHIIHNIIPSYFSCRKQTKSRENESFSFISVGNLIESKCFDLLIVAFAKLYAKNERVQLTIVGSGPLMKSLQKMVEDLGLSKVVCFTGAVQNTALVEMYNKSDCFVLPSRFETFGVVYAEALCTGTPIISTRNGGIEDIFEEGCGYLVDIDNEDALLTAMQKVMEDNFDHEAIAERFQTKFGETAFGDKIEAVYKEVLVIKNGS